MGTRRAHPRRWRPRESKAWLSIGTNFPVHPTANDRPASPLRLGPQVSDVAAAEIRREMELRHCKWDTQLGDVSVLAVPWPIVMPASAWAHLRELAERLASETVSMELELLTRHDLHARLGLPLPLRRLFERQRFMPTSVRVMRFDFHYAACGWVISEVNSDVPGGYTEATAFARLMS